MPSAGDNLSLGKLGRAVGTYDDDNYTTTTQLAADGRGSDAETKLSQFYISAVTTPGVPDNTPDENTSTTTTATFSNAGSLFLSRIGNRTQNFVWDETAGHAYFTLTENSDYTAPIAFGPVDRDEIIGWSVKYRDDGESDGFNDQATDYNTAKTGACTIQNTGGGPG